MLPDAVPVLDGDGVRLRPWRSADAGLVASVTSDPLIPLISTVPEVSDRREIEAYLARQHGRLAEGAGYSFAIADPITDEAVGNIGLWTSNIVTGRASTGYWIAPQFRNFPGPGATPPTGTGFGSVSSMQKPRLAARQILPVRGSTSS